MKKKRFEKEKLRKGIYILPNLFTSANLFCGFFAIIHAIDGKFETAAWAILIAIVFDTLDGKIARATNTSSKFGIEYDSLADLVSFGLAPGLMIYLWALKPFGRLGWLAAFLFVVCGALRLARFNSQQGLSCGNYFTGLPIPAGAGINATIVLLFAKLNMSVSVFHVCILIVLYTLSFLMVSSIKYNSFKKPELFKKIKFNAFAGAILIMIFIAAQPAIALFLCGFIYLVSGPVQTICLYKKNRQISKPVLNKHG